MAVSGIGGDMVTVLFEGWRMTAISARSGNGQRWPPPLRERGDQAALSEWTA
jgi:hypothetical protein